jgi:hypothetical protein
MSVEMIRKHPRKLIRDANLGLFYKWILTLKEVLRILL